MRKTIFNTISVIAALVAVPVIAADDMKGMDMKGMDMKGMDMGSPAEDAQTVHMTRGMVKKVDASGGKVTLAHEPVESLNWPAMTMGFKVQDKALLDDLAEGSEVEVTFTRDGKDYVITSVK